MNISPGPRIIIRNEIASESLINRRAADAVALEMRARERDPACDDCDFSRRGSSPVRARWIPAASNPRAGDTPSVSRPSRGCG